MVYKGDATSQPRRRLSLPLLVLSTLAGALPLAAQTATPPLPAADPNTLQLSLEDAFGLAAGTSESVAIAEADVARSRADEQAARSTFFPQVSATLAYTRTILSQFSDIQFTAPDTGTDGNNGGNRDTSALPFGQKNQYALGLTGSQLLFDGGETAARTRAAAAVRRSLEVGTDSARAEVLLDVTQSYFDALLADRLVAIAEGSLAQTAESLRQIQVAKDVGQRSEFELLRARVARDNQVPAVARNRADRDTAYLRLKQLLNLPIATRLALTTGVDESAPRFAAAGSTTGTTGSRPPPVPADERAPVRQAAEAVTAGEAQVAAARAQRLPALALVSRYSPVAYPANGIPGLDDFREDLTVGVTLSVPLLTGGRLRAGELAAKAGVDSARAQLAATREATSLDTTLAESQLAVAEATLTGNSATVDEATRAYSIAELRFREGLSTQIELADARLLTEQAEINRAQALRDVQVARARLALLRDLPLTLGGAPMSSIPSINRQNNPQNTTVTASTAGARSGAATAPTTGVPGIGGTGVTGTTIPGLTAGTSNLKAGPVFDKKRGEERGEERP